MTRYTLLIPSAQLFILNQWDPDLRLQAFQGKGSAGTASSSIPFVLGKITEKTTTYIDLIYNLDQGEIPVHEVYEKINKFIPDVSMDWLAYLERDCKMGNPDWKNILCKFTKKTFNPGVLKKFVLDGSYPMDAANTLLTTMKASVEDIPTEVKKRFTSSVLSLTTEPDIQEDEFAVKALKRSYMVFMTETSKDWELRDLDWKKKG